MDKLLIALFVLLLLSGVTSSQESKRVSAPATIRVEVIPNPAWDSLFKRERLELIVLYNPKARFSDTETKWSSVGRFLNPGARNTSIDILTNNDSILVGIQGWGIEPIPNCKYQRWVYKSSFDYVSVKPWETKFLKFVFPPICAFDSSAVNKTCPKCHKEDMTKIYVRAHPSVESNEPCDSLFFLDDSKAAHPFCQPNWYCARDQFEF